MSKTRVGIINVTGYAGVELARLLYGHPEIELTSVTGRSAAGQALGKVFPHLGDIDLTIETKLGEVDIAFSALPHKESAAEIIPLLEGGIKVVDISADFRLKEAAAYPEWYGFTHPAPELLQKAVYGLPELHRPEIAAPSIVARQGCYPSGALIARAPAPPEGRRCEWADGAPRPPLTGPTRRTARTRSTRSGSSWGRASVTASATSGSACAAPATAREATGKARSASAATARSVPAAAPAAGTATAPPTVARPAASTGAGVST